MNRGVAPVTLHSQEASIGLILQGYLVELPDGSLTPTTDALEATHAHALDPESGDIIVVTIAEAELMDRPREAIVSDTLMIYGV